MHILAFYNQGMPNTTALALISTEMEPQDSAMDMATTNVEHFLSGSAYHPRATLIVEEVLFNHALKHTIVYASRALRDLLQSQGLRVTLQYCNSPAHGHPVPFLTVRDTNGAFVVPTEVDLGESCGDFDLIVVDGSTNYTKLPTKRAHLKMCPSFTQLCQPDQAHHPQSTKAASAKAKLQPNAIVIFPSLLRRR